MKSYSVHSIIRPPSVLVERQLARQLLPSSKFHIEVQFEVILLPFLKLQLNEQVDYFVDELEI